MSKLKRSMAVSILFVFALALFSGIFTIPMIKTVHANPGWALQYSLPSSTPLRGIWGSSSTDVFAVGQTGTYPNFTGTIFHYDSAAWTQMAIGTTRPLYGIWGSSSTDVFAVGDNGTILHYNGTAWSTINSGTSNWLQDIWGSSSTDIFVVGAETILHYNGISWSRYNVSGINLQGIWGSSSTDVFAVGMSGTILHYNGNSWNTMNSNYTGWIRGIWGSSSTDVFAVGDSGTILHYNGTAWSKMTSGITNNLRGIWGSSSTDVFAVGDSSILHYDGIGWSSMSFPSDTLYSIWGNSSANIFAVGASRILHYQPTDTFTVTYDANGGSNPPTDSNSPYNDGATVTVLGTGGMTRTGYTFSKWNTQAGGSGTDYLPGATFTIRKNMILYAKWTINTYTVTFDSQGGSAVAPLTNVAYGSTISAPTPPTRTGYTFAGWYKDAACTNAWVFATDTVTSNITLYAKWTTNTYTVTFDSQGGSAVAPLTNVAYGSTISAPTPPTRTGYTFAGWYKDAACTNAWVFATDTVTSNITLYAQWTTNTYTVTFNYNYDGVTEPYATKSTDYNTSLGSNMPADPTRTGYTFASWNTMANGTGDTFTSSTVVTDNITVYAQWTINTYTLSTSQVGNGTVSKNPSQVTYDYGTSVELTATPSLGWHFVSWSGDDVPSGHETDNPLTIVMDANKTVTATFSNKYYITASVNNTNYGNISPSGSVEVTQGTDQSFTITPNTGYFLKQVLVDGVIVFPVGMGSDNEAPSYTYTFKNVTSNHTIQAVFAPGFLQYVITASAGEGGTISPSGTVIVPQFGSQTFTITPNTGYHILDVKVDGVSVLDELVDNKYTFENVSDNHTIDAYFEHNYIKTTYPVGTEVFLPTDTINVTWDEEGFTETEGKVRVLFYNGSTWSLVASDLDLADGSFDLDLTGKTISDPLRCRVRVGIYDPNTGLWLTWGTGKQYYDESGHFWVIDPSPTKYFKTAYPVGTEVFSPTSTIHITWGVAGFTETEGKIRIFFYNGSTWSLVASDLDLADGSFDLDLTGKTISDPLRCRVRVGIYDPNTGLWLTWGTNGQYYDESGHFWIVEQELPPTV